MRRPIASVFVVMILCFASPVLFAQEAAPVAENAIGFDTTSVPNDELTIAIKGLMKATGALDLGKQMGKNVLNAQQNNPNSGLPAEFFDRLIKEFDSEQTNRWMTNAVVRIYRQKFTLEEVKIIAAFYETPTGKKAISQLPAIMQESMQQGELIGRYMGMKVYMDLVKEGKIKQ